MARRAVEPSTLSLLGLVRHLAEGERGTFRRLLAGQDVPRLYMTAADPDGDFNGAVADPEVVAEAWRAGGQKSTSPSSSSSAAPDLDLTVGDPGNEHGSGGGAMSLRELLVGIDRGVRPPHGPRRPAARTDRRPTRPVTKGRNARLVRPASAAWSISTDRGGDRQVGRTGIGPGRVGAVADDGPVPVGHLGRQAERQRFPPAVEQHQEIVVDQRSSVRREIRVLVAVEQHGDAAGVGVGPVLVGHLRAAGGVPAQVPGLRPGQVVPSAEHRVLAGEDRSGGG